MAQGRETRPSTQEIVCSQNVVAVVDASAISRMSISADQSKRVYAYIGQHWPRLHVQGLGAAIPRVARDDKFTIKLHNPSG